MRNPALLLLPTILVVAPLASQDASPASPLVIKTSFADVASELIDGDLFEGDRDLPDLARGEHYVLTLDDGGRMHVDTSQGNAGLIAIHARPALLMEQFDEQVSATRQKIQGLAVLALGQRGMKSTEAIKSVRAAFELPSQIDVLTVKVTGDPDRPEDGYDSSAELIPVVDTWLDAFVSALRQSKKGAPVLDSSDAMMTLSAAVEVESLDLLDPFADFLAAMGAKSKADIEKYREFALTTLECSSGEIGVAWSSGGGMLSISSLRDAKRMKELQADPSYQEWVVKQARSNPSIDAEFDAAALEHRGVQVAKTTMLMDMPIPSPLFEDGEMVSFAGVAGNYSLQWMFGAGESDVKQVIDTVLDQKIEHAQLPETILFAVNLRIAEIADYVTGGMVPVDEIPEVFEAKLGKVGGALTCNLRIR